MDFLILPAGCLRPVISGRCVTWQHKLHSGVDTLLLSCGQRNEWWWTPTNVIAKVWTRLSPSGMVMIGSLKAYAPRLASLLGTTPAALYERQRALVRAGLLTQPQGRGPGSGVPVRPFEVAVLLIAVLATDSLSDTSEKVRLVSTARSSANNNACPLTGEQTFVEAVARVLDRSHDHWRKIDDITVRRTTGAGSISYTGDRDAGSSYFNPIRRAPQSRGLAVDATLRRELIIEIASDLKKIADSERHERAAALQRAAPAAREVKSRGRRRLHE